MGKIKKTILISLIFTVLLFGFATAAVEFASDELNLEVDYHDFNDENQNNLSKNINVLVRNTNAEPITVDLSAVNLPADYSANNVSQAIEANGESTFNFNVQVPHKQKNGDANIGFLVIKDEENLELDRINLVQKTKSMLELRELSVEYTDYNGNDEDENFDTRYSDKNEFELKNDIRIGSEITLIFDIKNLFDRNYDVDDSFIEKITLTIDADDSDIFPNDFEQEYSLEDLEAWEDQDSIVSFTIDEDADDGNYKLELTLEGEDGKGIQYKVKKTLSVELSRSRDDVRIDNIKLTPSSIELCPDNELLLDVKLQNYGTRDQTFVEFSLYNLKLKIDQHIEEIQIEKYSRSDNIWEKSFKIQLPEIIDPGTYPIESRVFIDQDDLVDEETVSLIVNRCSADIPVVEEPAAEEKKEEPSLVAGLLDKLRGNEKTGNEKTEEIEENVVEEGKIVYTIEDPYTTNDFIMAGLIMAVIVVLALITLFIVILLRK